MTGQIRSAPMAHSVPSSGRNISLHLVFGVEMAFVIWNERSSWFERISRIWHGRLAA
jgi:hypothetical protein